MSGFYSSSAGLLMVFCLMCLVGLVILPIIVGMAFRWKITKDTSSSSNAAANFDFQVHGVAPFSRRRNVKPVPVERRRNALSMKDFLNN